ncbi:type IV secretory system conjugative DNA transfer family protein [Enterococcus faecalis]|nr:type IV secretory system conjugative DNA transfer family protein [Enterococcus faecalis]
MHEGESGVPVLHFNLNPFRYFFWKIKGFNLPYCKNGYVFIDRNKTNSWVDAGTQSGKTEMWSYPTLDLIMRAGVKDSVIVTDLKGNMIKNTKKEFEKFGFDVFCLNLVQPSYSIGYNPLELIKNAYYVTMLGGPQLMGSNKWYASQIGTDYDWASYGWEVIMNPSYGDVRAGDVINFAPGGYAITEYGHTGTTRFAINV